jgi:DNA replication and repair protein RecF
MDVALQYRRGWGADFHYAEALQQSWSADQDRGLTLVGPHRAELQVLTNGVAAKDYISRGQQKLLAAALLIAQLRLFPADSLVQPTLLLDDPAAELDDERLSRLINEVAGRGMQLVVTTLHAGFAAFGLPGRSYRIHDGQLAECG